jgi:oligoendopeptidase F
LSRCARVVIVGVPDDEQLHFLFAKEGTVLPNRMLKRWVLVVLACVAVLAAAEAMAAKDRGAIDAKYKWDLTALFADTAAVKAEKERFAADMEKLADIKGRLAESATAFRQALDLYYGLELRMRRLESYVSSLVDQDTRVSANKGLKSEVSTLRTRFGALASFLEPELVSIDRAKLDGFFAAEPSLKIYRFPVSESLRRKAHILSPAEEKILAAAGDITSAPDSLYNLFTNADLPKATIRLADGTEAKLDYSTYARIRESLVESDRHTAFLAFFGQYDQFKRTLGEMLYTQMRAHRFVAISRGYQSTLAAALDYPGIDPRIYTSLIEAAHQNLATFHRYLKLKARALGKVRLDYYDMYVPFTAAVEIPVTYEKAQAMLIESCAPLGADYVKGLKEAFATGWIDVYPNEGKDSGAYMNGSGYGTHPYVLMNFNDTYSEVQTLAHEMGHAMHSYFSNRTQPFPTADYASFVAEVASTFNEFLLGDHLLRQLKGDDGKLYLLGDFLDSNLRGTFFRQILFAEFELAIHQKVEQGEALTDEVMNKIYLDLVRLYYGHDQGVTNVPDWVAVEWAYVPHFYYNYYVYQYSTSIAAASLIAQRILNKETGALQLYYDNLLRAGGSDNPVALLQRAGADMTNPQAYAAFAKRANRYMDELDKILKKQGK